MDHLGKLTEVLNAQPGLMAIRTKGTDEHNDYIHVVNYRIQGDKHVTVADYDGVAWIVKFYIAGVFVFQNISATPVELTRYILNHAE